MVNDIVKVFVPVLLLLTVAAQATERVSTATGGAEGNGESITAVTSDDGRYVVFASLASNLVAVDTNNVFDVFRNTNPAHVDDTDGDRVRNDIESLAGTDPNNADTDGDGVSDYDELNRDHNPYAYIPDADTDPNDSDTDNDGFSDGLENWANTDPLDKTSIPAIGDITGDGNVNAADILVATRIILSGNLPTLLQLEVLDIAPLVTGIPTGNNSVDVDDLLLLHRKALGLVNF